MNKTVYGLIFLICILISFIAVLVAFDWQKDKNNKIEIDKLTTIVLMQKKQIEEMQRKQAVLQMDIARTGVYDREIK